MGLSGLWILGVGASWGFCPTHSKVIANYRLMDMEWHGSCWICLEKWNCLVSLLDFMFWFHHIVARQYNLLNLIFACVAAFGWVVPLVPSHNFRDSPMCCCLTSLMQWLKKLEVLAFSPARHVRWKKLYVSLVLERCQWRLGSLLVTRFSRRWQHIEHSSEIVWNCSHPVPFIRLKTHLSMKIYEDVHSFSSVNTLHVWDISPISHLAFEAIVGSA